MHEYFEHDGPQPGATAGGVGEVRCPPQARSVCFVFRVQWAGLSHLSCHPAAQAAFSGANRVPVQEQPPSSASPATPATGIGNRRRASGTPGSQARDCTRHRYERTDDGAPHGNRRLFQGEDEAAAAAETKTSTSQATEEA